MSDNKQSSGQNQARSPRAKYLTLAALLLWVAAVFVFTLFKFNGGSQ